VAAAGRLARLFLACLSKPAGERHLYRDIRRRRVCRIVALGLSVRRAARMIAVAQSCGPAVWYTAIDRFDLRQPVPLPLKEAYRQLQASGARLRLVPGDPLTALSRVANDLLGTQLVVVSADQPGDLLEAAWFYVPRMLAAGARVCVEVRDAAGGETTWRWLDRAAVEALAAPCARRRAA
jgi:hypothetical protein